MPVIDVIGRAMAEFFSFIEALRVTLFAEDIDDGWPDFGR